METTDRVEKLLAMILLHDMHDAPQGEKVVALSRAGFSNPEIASLLGTTAAVVGQQRYVGRRKKSGRKKKAAARKKTTRKPARRGKSR